MALWDIVTLVVLGLGLLYGIWKGFLRILLKIGALILSVILARPLGNFISDTFVAGFFEGNRLEALLTFGASLLVTVAVFIILYILLKILAKIIASSVNKMLSTKKIDRVIGAIAGFAMGCGVMFVLGTVLEFMSAVATSLDIYVSWLDFGETFLFRFFL